MPPSQPTAPYGRPSYGPPSYGTTPYGPGYGPYQHYGQPRHIQPGMLAAAADRERTMDVLKAAFSEGRLTKEEFDARSARALSGRTYADLAAVIADLPVGPAGPMMPYPAGYYPTMVPPPPTNGLAIGALVCGLAELFTFGFASIPAIILGHLARAQIKRTGERGDGMAVAGLVFGYLGLVGWLFILLAVASHR